MAQARGEQFLVVEAQAFLALAGHQVQAEPQPRQRPALAFQRGVLVGAELTQRHQRFHVARADDPQRHPAQRLHVAQAARALLEVGLKVVGGVAEAGVAGAQLFAFGLEELLRRPDQ